MSHIRARTVISLNETMINYNIALENINKSIIYVLHKMATRIRPQGKFIIKMLNVNSHHHGIRTNYRNFEVTGRSTITTLGNWNFLLSA